MRPGVLAACAVLCVLPVVDAAAQVVTAPTFRIEWQVRNRFRLFRDETAFERHVAVMKGDGVLAAERRLARATDGRGWARDVIGRLCVDSSGTLVEICERDGVRENYLAPEDHGIAARLVGPVPPGATCTWSFDDGTIPPQQATAPCEEVVRLRVRYGRATIAAVGITRPDGSVDNATTEIRVRDLLIAGLGDSVAAGEGNPDVPVALADEGFCFRRFLGTGLSEYFRPSRAGFRGIKACEDTPGPPDAAAAAEWARHGARWMSAVCHRSLYSYQLRAALALAVENPHVAVTFLPLACTGATIRDGLLGSQPARECPLAAGGCPRTVPGQIEQLRAALAKIRARYPDRTLDLVLLTVGANDVQFSGLVADVIITAGVERVLFDRAGLIATTAQARRILDRELTGNFARLRAALKPLVGGDLERVVFVSYGNPALNGAAPCPGGRDGFDVHPAFAVDGERLRLVAEFVQSTFLPRLRALARCEVGGACARPESERMTFVDSHQTAFTEHGVCARAWDDPPFDRDCFRESGDSFNADPAEAAVKPLVCNHRPSEFRPYDSRARWVRTANDSYFTAMTYPRGLLAPANLHDAAWGALASVYGGAIHPTAEGEAAMADAALPAARALLGLPKPPDVSMAPLPPPIQ